MSCQFATWISGFSGRISNFVESTGKSFGRAKLTGDPNIRQGDFTVFQHSTCAQGDVCKLCSANAHRGPLNLENIMTNRLDQGMAVRREVLGDAHVDCAEAAKTPFDQPFQSMITEGAWGTLWADDTITRRERSMLHWRCWLRLEISKKSRCMCGPVRVPVRPPMIFCRPSCMWPFTQVCQRQITRLSWPRQR